MPEGTTAFQHDRAMSFCRVAYDSPTYDDWAEAARKRGLTGSNVWDFWRTAVSARRAGMAKELAFPLAHELEQKGLHVKEALAESLVSVLIGDAVVTNNRVLNYVLTHAGEIIGNRDLAPLQKFETLFAYLLKARREVLCEVEP